MAPKDGERSAASATRFTATTPHASSKLGSAAASPNSRFKPGSAVGGNVSGVETPEQRVARLRAAHEAAKNAKTSRFDQILAKSRPFFDSAHKFTVISLVGLTAVAGVMTAYTAYDMLRHNRKRKAEFLEVQKKMSADSLEAARLAYMRGEASDDQITLVEDAQALAEGQAFKMPSILSAPTPIRREADENTAPSEPAEKKSSKLWGLLSFGANKEEGKNSAEAGSKEEVPSRSLEEKRVMLESARAAFEKEKENQRNGGPLDRVGITETPTASTQSKPTEEPKKKGWFW